MTQDEALRELRAYRSYQERRDEIVAAALAAGVTRYRIVQESGLSKPTVIKIARKRDMEHEMGPWRQLPGGIWTRDCTCHRMNQSGHHAEATGDAMPPQEYLDSLPGWERDLVDGMTEQDWRQHAIRESRIRRGELSADDHRAALTRAALREVDGTDYST